MSDLDPKTYHLLLNGPAAPLSSLIHALFNFEPAKDAYANAVIILCDERRKKVYETVIQACRQKMLWFNHNGMAIHIVLSEKRNDGKPVKRLYLFDDYIVRFGELIRWAKPIFGDEIPHEVAQEPREVKQLPKHALTRERHSFLKIIYGFLFKLGHNPSAERSDTTQKVVTLLERANITMDKKTVKKIIDEAYDYGNEITEKK